MATLGEANVGGRMVPAWLLNTPANDLDEVVSTVSTLVRPNLLDNWYFGNPVDQRGGMLQLAGTMLYSDAECTQALFQSTKTTSIIKVSDIAAHPSDDSTVYVKLADCVRGYTGTWTYAIDRWFLGGEPSNLMEITDGGIHVSYTTPGWNVIQKLKNVLCKGKTYTFSVVYKSTLPLRLVVTWGDNKYFYNEGSPATSEWALATITGTVPNDAEITYEQVVFQQLGSVAGTMDIKAAKLEIGSTQTLAHQENGVWVLNEVPDYGEQLRRCQRYHYQVHYNQYETIGFAYDGPEYAFIILPLPTEMRGATPTLKIIGDISIGGKVRTLTGCNCHGCEAIIGVNYTAQPSSAGATYAYSTSAGGVTISIIYDL